MVYFSGAIPARQEYPVQEMGQWVMGQMGRHDLMGHGQLALTHDPSIFYKAREQFRTFESSRITTEQ